MSGKGKGRTKDEGDAEGNNFNHQTHSFAPVTKRGLKSSSKYTKPVRYRFEAFKCIVKGE